MSITLTEAAAGEVKRYMEAQKVEDGSVLRLTVSSGGCAGPQYTLGLQNDFDPELDARYEHHGVTLVTRKETATHLDGTTIDFKDGPAGCGFAIDNPNQPSCGSCTACGGQ